MSCYLDRIGRAFLVFTCLITSAAGADDFGDLPAPYPTLAVGGGPQHPISTNVYLGAIRPDAEADGRPSSGADGDDTSAADDEDAVNPDAVQCFRGLPLNATLRAMNASGYSAEICGFLDWNADGDFADAGETFNILIPSSTNPAVLALASYVTVPPDATQTQAIALRLRIYSKASPTGQSMGPGGLATDGEVEDYFLRPALEPIDFGDLPDGPYPTRLANDGARHLIVDGLCMGMPADAELDGAPSTNALGDDLAVLDDEGGFDPDSVIAVPGTEIYFPVLVNTPELSAAKLYGFTDWNNDGDFDDEGERSTLSISAAQSNAIVLLPWSVPTGTVVNTKVAVRLRITLDSQTFYAPPLQPYGYASSGEVEDYYLYVPTGERDYGDLPDTRYGTAAGVNGTAVPPDSRTRAADNGPSHYIRPDLYLGSAKLNGDPDIDGENDGQPVTLAEGDDSAGLDDETGLRVQNFVGDYFTESGMPYRVVGIDFEIPVHNTSGGEAGAAAFVDIEEDGTLLSSIVYGDGIKSIPGDGSVTNVSMGISYVISGTYGTPAAFTKKLAVRIRMGAQAYNLYADGPMSTYGEVHDEIITLNFPAYTGTNDVFDFGDLPDAPYRTLMINNGARHAVVPGLCIGERIDAEVDGAPVVHALGDDVIGGDDEDGFDPAAVVPVPGASTDFPVRVTTPSGVGAKLYGFTDWNNDGDFNDAGESVNTFVPAGLSNMAVSLIWNVPATAAVGTKLAVRLRLVAMDQTGFAQPLGPDGYAASGEVEDYFVFIPTGDLDFGDLPDPVNGVPAPMGPTIDKTNYVTLDIGDYATRLENDPVLAARHLIRPDLFIAATNSLLPIDAETNGQPNATATGDDLNGDDEDGVTITNFAVTGFDNVTPASADAVLQVSAGISVKNETGSDAWGSTIMFLDKDNPALLPVGGLGGILTVPSKPGFQNLTFNFTEFIYLPVHVTNANLKAAFRCRISTETATPENFCNWRLLRDGEVEDYVIDMPLAFSPWWEGAHLDFGDLNDTNYPTMLANNGARHQFTLGQQKIYLGANPPDGDFDGKSSVNADGDDLAGLDDEDGFNPTSVVLVAGMSTSFAVTVTADTTARLFGFADWNNDGDFADAGETSAVAVAGGSIAAVVNLPWTVPVSLASARVAVRLRLSSVAALGPDGLAPDGEVEDYMVKAETGYDFGDLPDSIGGAAPGVVSNLSTTSLGDYQTRLADDGPRHKIRSDLSLFDAGDPVDAEADGQPSGNAKGDNTNSLNDEVDAYFEITSQIVSNITSTSADVTVTILANLAVDNRTGDRAYLSGFIDANNDGDFADPGEALEMPVPSVAGYPSYNLIFTLHWTLLKPTVNWTIQAPFRFRLSTQQGLGPNGPAPDGEVEDYIVGIELAANPWPDDTLTVPLFDSGSPARWKLPPMFGATGSNFNWHIGAQGPQGGGGIDATGSHPVVSAYDMGRLPAGRLPYFVTEQRGATSLGCYFSFATVRDLPNFRAFMQRTSALNGYEASPDEDPDGDGRSNFEEYAHGTNPSASDKPTYYPSVTRTGSVTTLTIPYLRPTGGNAMGANYMTSELFYELLGSGDISTWSLPPSPAAAPGTLPTPPANYEWGAASIQFTNTAKGFLLRNIRLAN